jgi:hypothetical protein
MHPEAAARQQIDALFVAAGWVRPDYRDVDLPATRSIGLRRPAGDHVGEQG